MKKILLSLVFVILLSFLVIAQEEEHNFEKAKELIDSGISCSKLTNEQLEEIGDYYMEQMHPGESHEIMDKMMGGEGSESLRQVHINISRSIYCNENVGGMMGGGMMGMMPMMMNMMGGQNVQSGMMQGMMGNNPIGFGYNYWDFWNVIWLLFWIGIIVLIAWFIYKFTKRGKESETLINILQKKYAKGEINKREYKSMKKGLG